MITRNHLLTGMVAGVGVLSLFPAEIYAYGGGNVIFLAGVIFGSVAPDLDEPNSKPSRFLKMQWVAKGLAVICGGHRGFTHILFFPLIILCALMGLVAYLKGINPFIIFGIGTSLGIFVHQLGDLLTKSGIKGWASLRAVAGKKYRERFKETALLPKKMRFKVGEEAEGLWVTLVLIALLFYSTFFNDQISKGLIF